MDKNFPIKISKDGTIICNGEECRIGVLIRRAMDNECNGGMCPLAKAVRVTAACVGVAINTQLNDSMRDFRKQFEDVMEDKEE